MTRLSKLSTLLLLLAIPLLVACGGKESRASGPVVGEGEEARVVVINNNWLDMVVYAERGSMRQRLGTVTTMNRETLVIPRSVMAAATSIQLIAAPIGSAQTFASYPIDVWPGDTVEFRIENNMGISNVSSW